MSRKKRKKQSSAIVSCKKGLACLDLICAVQMLPQTVLADDSAVQVNPADSAVQVNPADSAVQVNPADSAAQMNPADFVQQADPVRSVAQDNSAVSAEADERLPGDQKEEPGRGSTGCGHTAPTRLRGRQQEVLCKCAGIYRL